MREQIRTMNAYIETLDDGNTVLYSYDTPILINVGGQWFTSPKKYSVTTTQQKNYFQEYYCNNTVTTVDHAEFVTLCKNANVPKLGRL